jgi:hypothetical protein
MGQSIECAARVDGKADRGAALLETDEVIFRGAGSRAKVAFSAMRSARVKDGWLVVAHRGGTLELELGARAEAWLGKIRKPKGIVEKLGVKAGARVAIVAWEDADLTAGLEAGGATVRAGAPRGEVDVIILGVRKTEDLAKVAGATRKLAKDGALWIVRPKGKEGVPEASVMRAGHDAGLVDVKVARYSETHTAEKFVIPLARR